jgi:hypothetical protein
MTLHTYIENDILIYLISLRINAKTAGGVAVPSFNLGLRIPPKILADFKQGG